MADLIETSELLAFARTVDARSLSRAAAELAVPRATISRRLARLEERLGARLLRRTTRSLVLTDAGEALYRHARIVLEAVRDAEASVRRTDDVVRGALRVSAPPFMYRGFLELVCSFARTYPDVRLSVSYATSYVDLRGGYDVAIRASRALEPGLVARTLARMPILAVASPAYLAEKGTPRTSRDLRAHRCLMGFERGELPQTHWTGPGGRKLHVEGVFFSNDMLQLREAALAELGIALLPELVVRGDLASGALVRVMPSVLGGDARLSVVYAERELVPPQVRAFVDAVVAWAPAGLAEPPPACDAPKHARGRGRTR